MRQEQWKSGARVETVGDGRFVVWGAEKVRLISADLSTVAARFDEGGEVVLVKANARGDRLAIARRAGPLTLWDISTKPALPLDEAELKEAACERIGRPLTPEEWATYFPARRYFPQLPLTAVAAWPMLRSCMVANRRRSCLSCVTLLIWSFAIAGCGVADGEWQVQAGKRFPFSNITDIKKGMDASQVTRILGDPLEKRTRPNSAVVWRYYVRQVKTDSYLLFDKVPVRHRTRSGEAEALIDFGDGRVTNVQFRHNK